MPGARVVLPRLPRAREEPGPRAQRVLVGPRFVGARRRRGAARGDPGDRRGGPGAGRRHARAGWGRSSSPTGPSRRTRCGSAAQRDTARAVAPARPGHRAGAVRPVHQRLPDGGRRAAARAVVGRLGAESATVSLGISGADISRAPGDRPVGGGRGDLERRRALRRARLPGRRRDDDHPADPGLPRGGADAGRDPDGDLPGALGRPPGPGHPVGRGRVAAHPPRRRVGVRPRRGAGRCRAGGRRRFRPGDRDHLPAHGREQRARAPARSPGRSSTSRGC